MDNQDYSSLKKELESVFVQNFDVIVKDKPEKKQKEDNGRDGGIVRNSGGATSVKKLKTVQ